MSQGALNEESSFRPHINVEGETTVPSSICLFGVTGGKWNLIEVPQPVLDLPLEKQLVALSELMGAYLERYDGFCPFFGRVTGFWFVRSHDYFQFDKNGMFMERVDEVVRRGQVMIQIG